MAIEIILRKERKYRFGDGEYGKYKDLTICETYDIIPIIFDREADSRFECELICYDKDGYSRACYGFFTDDTEPAEATEDECKDLLEKRFGKNKNYKIYKTFKWKKYK